MPCTVEQIEICETTKAVSVAAAITALSACGGADSNGNASAFVEVFVAGASPASDAEAARFLQQAQFSSTEAEIANLRRINYPTWLRNQFEGPMGPTGWDWLESRGYGENNTHTYYFASYPADFMVWNQLMTAPDAMRKRAALALSEFFVISLNASEFTWRSHAVAHWWDMLARNAFGNFRQLLEDVTLHPTMGWFLNTKGNQKEDPYSGRVPDENYAREVMQLFSIGLYELNSDGTERRDASGNRIETYTQADVTNLARVFTGYDFDTSDGVRITPPGETYTVESKAYAAKPMALNPDLHSMQAVTFLGTTIAAGTPAPQALKAALEHLFQHANVGPFFGRQMIQRLVTSNPSTAYVARVAAAFNNNGVGVRGDLRAVWTAILLDPEARGAQGLGDIRFGKLRESMLRLVQWVRTFGAVSQAGSWKIGDSSSTEYSLGQSPLRPPSVFNYYRPGFVPPGTPMAAEGASAPEFQTINETTVGAYLNYMRYVVGDGIYVDTPGLPYYDYSDYAADISTGYTRQLALVTDATALVLHLGLVLCAGQLSADTQKVIVDALNATPVTTSSTAAEKRDRIAGAIFLIMACPEYLIQK
jgi:uncharacterized protein (DUF1800 family)